MLLALLLAGLNALPPLLFFVYCCTRSKVLDVAVGTCQVLATLLFSGARSSVAAGVPHRMAGCAC